VSAALHSVLAAGEPSKVPFYVMGGVLAAWAVVLSAIGLSQADFPGTAARARAVMAISAVLVLGTVTSAVATSSKHHEEGEAQKEGQEPAPGKPPPPAPPGGGGGATLQVSADPTGQLKFEQTSLSAKAGKVKIDFDNPSSVPHAVEVEGNGVEKETEVVTKGKSSVSVDLKAGTYEIYCPVGKHKQAGMEGTLTVN
jgi:plastocyanin